MYGKNIPRVGTRAVAGGIGNVSGVKTLNKTGGEDGKSALKSLYHYFTTSQISVPGVGKIEGAEDITSEAQKSKAHSIGEMDTKGIPKVGNPGTCSRAPVEQGSNNENK